MTVLQAQRSQSLERLLGTRDDGKDLDIATGRTTKRTNFEVPLRWSLTLSDRSSLEQDLNLLPVESPKFDLARRMLLANLLGAHGGGCQIVFYSRDHNHYARVRSYAPPYYRYATVLAAIDQLDAAGLIVHRQTRPSPRAKQRSCMWPTQALANRLQSINPNDLCLMPPPPVVLRDAHKHPIALPHSARIYCIAKDVEAHNVFLGQFAIRISHPNVKCDAWGRIHCGDLHLDGRRTHYFRVFNRSMQLGGRWFGPYWQNLPQYIRGTITIDGEPTVEVDYATCHLRLLSARHGIIVDADGVDPFTLPGHRRSDLKLTFNVLVNASRKLQARAALLNELRPGYGPETLNRVLDLIATIQNSFPDLATSWFTGIGRRLQNIDSDICARVQRYLRRQDVPCLSVHDSFIVPASHQLLLREVMDREFAAKVQTLLKIAH